MSHHPFARPTALAVAGIAGAGVLLVGSPALAHDGHDHGETTPSATPGKGLPTVGPEFFLNHLDTYHFGRAYVGFDNAAKDPYRWFVYHFTPTGLETAQRAVSPKDAPEVEGDTWATKKQPVSEGTDGHGPPSHDGDDLRTPVSPTAGVKYANLWAQQTLSKPDPAAASEAVPAVQETVRRTLTPTEQAPPVENDDWTDKRPKDSSGSIVVVPGNAIKPVADASKEVSTVTGPILDGISGEHDQH